MAALTNTDPNSTYVALLQVGDAVGLTSTIKTVYDGLGNTSPLGLSTVYVTCGNISFTSNIINTVGSSTITVVPNTTFSGNLTVNGTITASGGLSISNPFTAGSVTVTLGGNFTTAGAYNLTLTQTGNTNVTLPTSGTLVNSAVTTLSSLTSIGTITSGVWNGTSIPATNGGTGASLTIAQGDILYGANAGVIANLAKSLTSKRYLTNTGASNNPAWGPVDLANGVSGNLPVTNLNSGTLATSSTFWRGDGTWAAATGGSAPQPTTYVSGSGTYSTPANALYLVVELIGAGGGSGANGGTGQTAGGNGANTTFGTAFLTGGGGSGSTATVTGSQIGTAGGAGGTAGGGDTNIVGAGGSNGDSESSSSFVRGGNGGSGYYGGAGGSVSNSTAGLAAQTNSGAGAGGAGGSSVVGGTGGGGSGGYVKKLIVSPSSTYAYSVGTAGTAGSAGTSGVNGAAGGSGIINITAYFQ